MSSYRCPDCGREEFLFGKGKGEKLAKTFRIPFLGGIPLDGQCSDAADGGVPIVFKYPDSLTSQAMAKIADEILVRLPPREKVVVRDRPWHEGRDHHKQ
jgi:ATP-binding protein involved in chromosome partitioning